MPPFLRLVLIAPALLIGCAQPPTAPDIQHPLAGRIFEEIDPNLPPQELTRASFQSPTLKLRDIFHSNTADATKWEVLFQTSDYSDVFRLMLIETGQKISQMHLVNTTYASTAEAATPSAKASDTELILDPAQAEDVSRTLNMLNNLKKASFDANNVANLAALIRLLGGDPVAAL